MSLQQSIVKWDEVNGASDEKLKAEAFVTDSTDTYAILQLRYAEESRDERYESYSALQRRGLEPDIDHYEIVYAGPLLQYENQTGMLEKMYEKFNLDRPDDFRGHSLSVSDVVMLRENGMVSAHYVDSVGFAALPGFYSSKNHIRTLEDQMEQNDNQLDGILNNLAEEQAPCRCTEEKKDSIIEQLQEAKKPEGPSLLKMDEDPDRSLG